MVSTASYKLPSVWQLRASHHWCICVLDHLPVQLLGLGSDLELHSFLLCTRSVSKDSHNDGRRCSISPRSLILKTPLTVLDVLRCLMGLLSLGDAGASSMAESTLLRGMWAPSTAADMAVVCVRLIGLLSTNLWAVYRDEVLMKERRAANADDQEEGGSCRAGSSHHGHDRVTMLVTDLVLCNMTARRQLQSRHLPPPHFAPTPDYRSPANAGRDIE